jgi:glycine betaine/proline transport system permease protein
VIGLLSSTDDPTLVDNEVLDEYTIPFGEWIDQAVDWIAVNLTGLLELIEWPFKTLLDLVVNDFLLQVSWVLVVTMMFLIAWLVRNLKVAFGVAAALTLCGLLGDAYWIETARTIGYIAVAVGLCVVIGLPIGILCGRLDGAWTVTRPTLDAMQVVHAFVYMLPFIFFWGIGPVAATMATMVFALPPLIRLTNLGVRQVPEEVVEASRAYGAPEYRVLLDVQIPLARPAIMTGVNQTLLMSISMLGIAAIMGAGGLGRSCSAHSPTRRSPSPRPAVSPSSWSRSRSTACRSPNTTPTRACSIGSVEPGVTAAIPRCSSRARTPSMQPNSSAKSSPVKRFRRARASAATH